jgi:hypothetical protein
MFALIMAAIAVAGLFVFAKRRIQARKYRRHYFPPVDRGTYWHP